MQCKEKRYEKYCSNSNTLIEDVTTALVIISLFFKKRVGGAVVSLKRVAASNIGSLQRKMSVLKESTSFSHLSAYSFIVTGSFICK